MPWFDLERNQLVRDMASDEWNGHQEEDEGMNPSCTAQQRKRHRALIPKSRVISPIHAPPA